MSKKNEYTKELIQYIKENALYHHGDLVEVIKTGLVLEVDGEAFWAFDKGEIEYVGLAVCGGLYLFLQSEVRPYNPWYSRLKEWVSKLIN